MKTKNELIKQWLDRADKDLKTANQLITFDDAVFESICFSCQQATEKNLKAYLIFFDDNIVKTHDIGVLIKKCSVYDNQLLSFLDDADELTTYAVETRYPDNYFEIKRQDALKAIEVAIKIKTYVVSKIYKQDYLFK
jgi:HEPN domain-containing protein